MSGSATGRSSARPARRSARTGSSSSPTAARCSSNGRATGGVTGKSLNIYDAVDRRWHQTWVDNSGSLLILAGQRVDRNMVMALTGQSPTDPKATVLQRITWTPADDGSVRQLWELSSDAGKTWTVLFDGHYVRAK
jgi:hypothetical protein